MDSKTILLITSKFPSNISTFISRDMQIFVNNGYKVDIYAITPLNEKFWRFVPRDAMKLIENGEIKVYNFTKLQLFFNLFKFWRYPDLGFFKEAILIAKESTKYGKKQLFKSLYTILWTLTLKQKCDNKKYFKVISYWSNYSATGAYLFSKYSKYQPSFITYSHAGVDLYRDQIYLLNKFLYAQKVITVCKFNLNYIKELYPDHFQKLQKKINIYHLPLKIKKIPNVTKKHNQIIAVSTLHKRKGIDYLIRAAMLLKDNGVNFNIVIIGGGEEESNLKNLVSELKLKDRVEFLGHLPYEDVEQNIASSSVLAHCSPELGDAVPTVIKEALMLGTPVVGSDIVGIPELLDYGNCGLLFEPKNEYQLYQKLKLILENRELQQELSQKGREYALKMFDIDKNSKQLIKIIES